MARPVYLVKRCDCDCATQTDPCECPEPSECYLTIPTLLMDGDDTPYADETAAAAALAALVSGCIAEMVAIGGGSSRGSHSTVFSSGTLAFDSTVSTDAQGAGDQILVRLKFDAAATITIHGVATISSSGSAPYAGGLVASLFDSSGSPVDSDVAVVTTLNIDETVTVSVPSAGEYDLMINMGSGTEEGGSGSASSTNSIDITADQPFTPCTVRAAHGGTPDYLVCTP